MISREVLFLFHKAFSSNFFNKTFNEVSFSDKNHYIPPYRRYAMLIQ